MQATGGESAPARGSRARVRSFALFGAKAVVTGVILWTIFGRIELSSLKNSLAHVNFIFVVAAVSLWIPLMISAAQRWRLVALALGNELSFRAAFIYTWIGSFISLGLPTLLALDAFRILQLQRHRIGLSSATRLVIVDRTCSFAALLMVITMGIPKIVGLAGGHIFKELIISAVVCGVLLLVVLATMHLAKTSLSSFRGMRHIWQLSADVYQVLLSNIGRSAKILLLAACNHLCRVGIVICLAYSLRLDLSLPDAFALVPASFLITLVPISIGGWGVREAVFIGMLGLVGIAAAGAFALSILHGLVGTAIGLLGGAVWMAERRLIEPASCEQQPLRIETNNVGPLCGELANNHSRASD